MTNKPTATDFLEFCSAGRVREAYDKFVAADFVHHSPYFKAGRDSLMHAMEEATAASPNKSFEVQRVVEEGDIVAVHSHVQQADGTDIAVVHIMRFADGKIAELWDVGLVVPEDMPNEDGVF